MYVVCYAFDLRDEFTYNRQDYFTGNGAISW